MRSRIFQGLKRKWYQAVGAGHVLTLTGFTIYTLCKMPMEDREKLKHASRIAFGSTAAAGIFYGLVIASFYPFWPGYYVLSLWDKRPFPTAMQESLPKIFEKHEQKERT